MSDRPFSHPNIGRKVRIEQRGRKVHLIFVAETLVQADNLTDELLRQLRSGVLHMTLMGVPTSIEES